MGGIDSIATIIFIAAKPKESIRTGITAQYIGMGTTGYGVYTASLVALGNRFSGAELINGSAAFGVIWGFGALLGSVSGGLTMLASASHGLPIGLALIYLLLAAGITWRQLSQKRLRGR